MWINIFNNILNLPIKTISALFLQCDSLTRYVKYDISLCHLLDTEFLLCDLAFDYSCYLNN